MKKSARSLLAALGALALFSGSIGWGQGSLTPPGAPAPTMKRLDQVEPRTPIAALPYTITSGGSYYVVGNLTGVASSNGITVAADDVAIDLNGFTLVGVPGSLSGIAVSSPHRILFIGNGAVQGWGSHGIDAGSASVGHFERLTVSSNAVDGLIVGSYSLVHDCLASGNTSNGVHLVGIDSRADENSFTRNKRHGIKVEGTGNLITRNSASFNTFSGYNIATNNYAQLIGFPNLNNFSNATAWANFMFAVPACNDGVMDGRETGVDCGGDCPPCP